MALLLMLDHTRGSPWSQGGSVDDLRAVIDSLDPNIFNLVPTNSSDIVLKVALVHLMYVGHD